MPLRERAYYGLDEIRLGSGLLAGSLFTLSRTACSRDWARVWDAVIEEGDRAADGQTFRLPTDQRRFSGLLDFRPQDAYRLLRDQMAVIDAFDAPEGEYLVVLRPEDGIEVRLDDLVVRRDERDRFERTQRPALPRMNGNTFKVVGDYKEVIVAGRLFHLGTCQGGGRPPPARGGEDRGTLALWQGGAGGGRIVVHADGRSVQVAAALARADRIRRPRSLPARHPHPPKPLISYQGNTVAGG